MILQIKCRSCYERFKLEKKFASRPDLIHEMGEYFNLTCSHCSKTWEYHANDVVAESSFSGNLIGTIIGLLIIVGTTLFAWNQGFITNIGIILGVGVIAASNGSALTSNVNGFNSYRVSRTKRD